MSWFWWKCDLSFWYHCLLSGVIHVWQEHILKLSVINTIFSTVPSNMSYSSTLFPYPLIRSALIHYPHDIMHSLGRHMFNHAVHVFYVSRNLILNLGKNTFLCSHLTRLSITFFLLLSPPWFLWLSVQFSVRFLFHLDIHLSCWCFSEFSLTFLSLKRTI